MREYSMLRKARRPGTRTPFEPMPDRPGSDPFDVVVERAQLTEQEVIDVAADPSIAALTPTMLTRLIAPLEARPPAAGATAWGIAAVGADTSPFDGSGVTVAMLDTGIDASHAAFTGIHLLEQDFTGTGNADDHGHGTHGAGTLFGRDVGGTRIGVARGVSRALIGKVLTEAGGGRSDWLQEAVLWACREGAQVIAMSIQFDFPGTVAELVSHGLPVEAATSVALEHYRANVQAIDALIGLLRARADCEPGAVIVAASGNESRRDARPPQIAYRVSTSLPAAATGAIAVGAIERRAAGLIVAPFSSSYPQVCAPGVGVLSARAGGGLVEMSGTSMATSHAAGVAAMWWQRLGTCGREALVTASLLASSCKEGFAAPPDSADAGVGAVTAPR